MTDTAGNAQRRTAGVRCGGRSARVVENVLEAAVAELARVGYNALRVEDVAVLAKVNKTTVYRRWPTKSELIADAIRSVSGFDEPLPDTGTIRGDLIELTRRSLAFARKAEGRAVARLIVAEGGTPEVDALARLLRDQKRAKNAEVITRAVARGELPQDTPADLVVDAITSPLMARAMRFNERVDHATIVALVDLVVTGAENVGKRGSRTR